MTKLGCDVDDHVWGGNTWSPYGKYWFRFCSRCGAVDRWRTVRTMNPVCAHEVDRELETKVFNVIMEAK